MSQTHFYEVSIRWKKERIGELSSPVLEKTIECATPPGFPNGVPNIWSPEHLFVAAINSCYIYSDLKHRLCKKSSCTGKTNTGNLKYQKNN